VKKFLLIPLTLILASGLIFSGCPGPGPAQETLKIGIAVPLTGSPSAAGLAFKNGAELAVEKINEGGGLKIGDSTYMVEIIVEDTKGSSEGAKTAATKLCYQSEVKVVVGSVADFETSELSVVTSEAGVLHALPLLISAADLPGSFADVAPEKPLVIRIGPAVNETEMVPIQYLVEKYPSVKTIGLMALAFPDYDALPEYYSTPFEALGLEVSPDYERFAPDLIDFVPSVTRLLETKPDAIFDCRSTLGQFPLIVKTARESGFNGPIIYPLICDPSYATEVLPNVSDVITCGIPMDDPDLPDAIKEVIELGQAKYGAANFIEDSVVNYDHMMMLFQILVKANSLEPQKVVDTFETLTEPGDVQSIFGPSYVGGLNKTGVNRVLIRPTPISIVVNGEGKLVRISTIDIP
jgi:branched-chain amino acid transport system substrate-binding protein